MQLDKLAEGFGRVGLLSLWSRSSTTKRSVSLSAAERAIIFRAWGLSIKTVFLAGWFDTKIAYFVLFRIVFCLSGIQTASFKTFHVVNNRDHDLKRL